MQDSTFLDRASEPFPRIRNLFDRISYNWVQGLMTRGNKADRKNPLEFKDLYVLRDEDKMDIASERFSVFFQQERESPVWTTAAKSSNLLVEFWKSPVTRAIVKMYEADNFSNISTNLQYSPPCRHKNGFIASGLLKFTNTVIQFFPSLLIARILKFSDVCSSSHSLLNQGMYLSLMLFLVLCAKTVIENQYFDMVIKLGASIRGTLSTAIYRKALRLGPSSRKNNTVLKATYRYPNCFSPNRSI